MRHQAEDSLFDWERAVATANRFNRGGPAASPAQARTAVESLRRLADVATGHVAELTRLDAPGPIPPTRVVDRPGWVAANARGMDSLLTPLMARLRDRHPSARSGGDLGRRITGVQTGTVLAFLSTKVLGQYEIFAASGGELLLVAPNIVEAERKMAVDPADFRLWVCLHEATHRLQFTAVPWLRDYLIDRVTALVDALDATPAEFRDRIRTAVAEMSKVVRSGGGQGLLALIQGEKAKAVMSELTALMSLVEGHAEFVMDEVGPSVVPSVASIRAKFTTRRNEVGPIDWIIRRLLGMDAKMRQYAEGAVFVRHVVGAVGMDGLNRVWASPETLPSYPELRDPAAWVRRVHAGR